MRALLLVPLLAACTHPDLWGTEPTLQQIGAATWKVWHDGRMAHAVPVTNEFLMPRPQVQKDGIQAIEAATGCAVDRDSVVTGGAVEAQINC